MSESQNEQNTAPTRVISGRRGIRKRGIVIVAVIAVLAIGGMVAASLAYGKDFPPYAFVSELVGTSKETNNTDEDKATDEKPATTSQLAPENEISIQQQREKVAALVAAGDPQSVKQAEQAVEAGVVEAEKSGDEAYTIEAKLEKAALLLDTGRPQEALDAVLLALERDYKTNETYILQIYSYIGQAYLALDNTARADEYFAKIPPVVGD